MLLLSYVLKFTEVQNLLYKVVKYKHNYWLKKYLKTTQVYKQLPN